MLLFIMYAVDCVTFVYGFNTSHVVIYPINSKEFAPSIKSFNTSHVVIYRKVDEFAIFVGQRFQYISCCYLSFKIIATIIIGATFQYISCCYLSNPSSTWGLC